jgi:hypothetical protein
MEVVFVKVGGTTFRALTAPELAKKLVRAGVPDQMLANDHLRGHTRNAGGVAPCSRAPGPPKAGGMKVSNSSIEALTTEKTELQLRLLKLNELPDSSSEKLGEIAKMRERLQEIERLIEDWMELP